MWLLELVSYYQKGMNFCVNNARVTFIKKNKKNKKKKLFIANLFQIFSLGMGGL